MSVVIFTPTVFEAKGIFGSPKSWEGFQAVELGYCKVIITGVGKTNAAITVMRYFQKFALATPILLGIAGAYPEAPLKIGEAALIKRTWFVDEGILTETDLKLSSEIGFPVCDGNVCTCRTLDLDIKVCDENTVSLISGNKTLSDHYYKKTGAWIESMEGAAFAKATEYFGLESIQIRAVSNPTADPNFRLHTKEAFESLKETIKKLLNKLS